MVEEGVRPGYRTTEFWLTLGAEIVSVVLASGVIEAERELKIAALVGAVLSRAAYVFGRSKVKAAE